MEIYNRKYLLWIFIINFIYSQEINRCSTEEYYEQLILNNPILLDSQSEFENRILSYYQRNNSNRNNDSMNPLELAMVLDSDSRTIWGQIVHTTPIVRLVDEFYPLQWHLNNTGQSGGISGYDINTELAWDITTGSEEIIVAVIDDGVEEHEDFEDWIKLILWERERLFK